MINVYLRLLDFMDRTPVSSADVYVTLRVTPILRPGSPIPGVDVPTILPPILPPTLQDDSFVERPPSVADGTTLADGQDDVFVERRTSAADGTLGCSFDVSNEAFQGAFERQSVRIRSLKDGELYEVGAGLGVDVACAGLQRSFDLTWLPRLHEPADVRQDIAVDFAKPSLGIQLRKRPCSGSAGMAPPVLATAISARSNLSLRRTSGGASLSSLAIQIRRKPLSCRLRPSGLLPNTVTCYGSWKPEPVRTTAAGLWPLESSRRHPNLPRLRD